MCWLLFILHFIISSAFTFNALTNCTTGRNTHYENNQKAGSCGYGSLLGPMGPGYLFIAAANDNKDPNFGGFSNSLLCGVCFQLSGPYGTVRLMITDHCPDCPVLQPHFDCSPEAFSVLSGGISTLGLLSNSFRKVACDVVGNVKVQFKADSNNYFIGLLFANHRVGITDVIQVKENGMTSFYEVQRKPYNYFEFNPKNGDSGPAPMDIILTSEYGDQIKFTLDSISPGAIIDTGGQFPVPIFSSPDSSCLSCNAPTINNYQSYIYQDSFFPDQSGVWLPSTQQQWADWSGRDWQQHSSDPYAGEYCARTNMSAWDTLNFGCNIPTPKDQVTSFEFAVKLASGSTSEATIWFDDNDHITLPPLNTSWVHVVIPIANSNVITGSIHNLQIQNGREPLTYFFDEMKFVIPKPPLCGDSIGVRFSSFSVTTTLPLFILILIGSLININ